MRRRAGGGRAAAGRAQGGGTAAARRGARPADPELSGRRCEIQSGPDKEGRYRFTLYWTADYHPGHPEGEHRRAERGQCFHAALPECATSPKGQQTLS